jgi:hypothetical protein
LLQATVNINCLAISHSNHQEKTEEWLRRLQYLFKYAIILSSLWKPSASEMANQMQSKIAESCSYILAFMFQELHQSKNPTLSPSNA